ncbi:trigger factor [Candidatus Omnitrophota bacterium]
MKCDVKNISGCQKQINIEISGTELSAGFERVYADIRKSARIPGFRPGKAPRDLIETRFGGQAKEELLRRAIPEYYMLAVKQQELFPVAPPDIENVQLQDDSLKFSAKVDVRPEVKIKSYKKLKLAKKNIAVTQEQINQALERLRASKAKDQQQPPKLDDQLAKDLGFNSLTHLQDVVRDNLNAQAEAEAKRDLERQLLEQLLKRAALDVPESLVKAQTQETFKQIRMNCILRGEKEEDIQAKETQLQQQAQALAAQRVKLSFMLDKIAELENIQVEQQDLEARIEGLAQHTGKSKDEVQAYLEKENLLGGIKAELRDGKTVAFLMKEAEIKE